MNILCFAPFSAAWDLHGYIEMGILQSLREKRANIIYIFCDIQSEYCYLFLHGKANCSYCKQRSAVFAADKNMPYIWLSRFAHADDHAAATAFVESLPPEEYPSADYNGKAIGRWVLSTFISFLRENSFDSHNPVHVNVYKGMLVFALETALALERLLRQGRFDRVIMFNGRFLPFSILLDMAESQKIPCYLHERGSRPNTLCVVRHDPSSRLHPMTITPPESLLALPLTPAQLEKTQALMLQAETGDMPNWDRFSPTVQYHDLRAHLGIEKNKRIWAFFVSSDDEMASFRGYEYPDFPTQLDGLMRIIQITSRFSDVHLVIRMHPNSGAKGTKRVPWADKLTAFLRQRNYHQVTVIAADDQVNSYQIMWLAEFGMVSCSSCAAEMLHRGKPSMAFYKSITPNEGIFLADSNAAMENILHRFHEKDISRDELKECFRKSLRYKHFKFFQSNIPFEVLTQTSPHTVRALFRRVEEIKNIRYPALNKLSEQILNGDEITFDYFENEAQHSSLDSESAWLDTYMERWFTPQNQDAALPH